MNLGRQLALTRPWWMWRNKEIQDALRVAKLRHCLPAIYRALESNRNAGHFPANIKDLGSPWFLDRDPRNVERMEDGTYALTDQHLLGLSVVLKIPLQDLFPSASEWIQGAACELCGRDVCPSEARAYALYRIDCLMHPTSLVEGLHLVTVEKVFGKMTDSFPNSKEVERAILKVCRILGKALERLEGKNR